MAGRPTSLTKEVHETIIGHVRKGVWLETAAAAAGVHRSSVYNWKERGERENAEEPYASFALELAKAEAENEIAQLDALLNARPAIPGEGGRGADVWTNKAWYLERRYPAKYSGKVRATVEDLVEQAMRRLASVLDADSLEKARVALRPDTGSSSASDDARH